MSPNGLSTTRPFRASCSARRGRTRKVTSAPASASRPPKYPPTPPAPRTRILMQPPSGVHSVEEIGVVLRLLQLVDKEFEPVIGAHRHEDAAQHPHFREDAAI